MLNRYLDAENYGKNDTYVVMEMFYPRLTLTWVKEIEVYTVDSFISNVGGQLGEFQNSFFVIIFH